jgi:signal transduction histidine kinase
MKNSVNEPSGKANKPGFLKRIRWQLLSAVLPVTIIPMLILVLLVSNGIYRYIIIQNNNFYFDMLGQVSRSIDSMYTRYAGILSEIIENPSVQYALNSDDFESIETELQIKKDVLDGFSQVENMKVDGRVYIIDKSKPSLINKTDYSVYYNYNYPMNIDIDSLLKSEAMLALKHDSAIRMILAGYDHYSTVQTSIEDMQQTIIMFPWYNDADGNNDIRSTLSGVVCILLKPFHLRSLYRDLEKLKPGTLFIIDRFNRVISRNHPSPDDLFPWDDDKGAYIYETELDEQGQRSFNDYELLVTNESVLEESAVKQMIHDIRSSYFSVSSNQNRSRNPLGEILSLDKNVEMITWNGTRYMVVVEFTPAAQATLAYFYPVELMLRPIRILLVIVALTAFFMILGSLFFIIVISGRITRPIIALSEEADKIADGIFKGKPVTITADNEIDILVGAFNRMINQVTDYAENLEHKVAERTMELEKATSDRTRFFINLAHETKTPLTLIKNYLEDYMKNTPDDPRLDVIESNIIKLLNDMVNYLDIQKLEKGETFYDNSQHVSFSDVLESSREIFEHAAKRKKLKLEFTIQPNCTVSADPFALERIIYNCISNAIKYTGGPGSIVVSLTGTRSSVQFKVKDTGIGIEEDRLKTIFLPFYRVTHDKRSIDGMGVGLSIVDRIVSNLEGTIEVTSTPGAGTKFLIEIPSLIHADPIETKPGLTKTVSPGSSSLQLVTEVNSITTQPGKQRVLLVEDNCELLTLMANTMSSQFQVYTAESGNQALSVIKKFGRPDIVISDLMMDGMDGVVLLETLQQDEKYRDIPFIFITARTDIVSKIDAFDKGAVDYIAKPFSVVDLVSRVKALLRYNRMKRIMFEQEKFASIGMLVSGITHQIFNPLSGISASIENLEKSLSDKYSKDSSAARHFSILHENIERIISIIKSLKLLSYSREIPGQELNLYEVTDSVIQLLGTRLPGGVSLENRIDPGISIQAGYPVIAQVLMNLLTNAIDAVSDSGSVIISSSENENCVAVSVSDDGHGIDAMNRDRIFDAFYTTRDPGSGTGLGLYIVKDLVLNSGWEIEITSSSGNGTEFTVTIPHTHIKGESDD